MSEVEEEVPGSDSSDTGSSESVVSPAAKIITQPHEVRASEADTAAASLPPQTPDRPDFDTSPAVKVTESEIAPDDNEHTDRVHDIVVPDDDSKFDDDVTLAPFPSAGLGRFNSIGRRDSLHLNSRPVDITTRPKTKRELERERLFKMVDEEIAETSPTEPSHRHSWGVQGIGSGSGFNFVGSLGSLSSPRTEPPDSPQLLSESDGQRQAEHEPRSEVLGLTDDHVSRHSAVSPTVPVRPSPLNAEPLSVPHSAPSTTAPSPALSPANDIDLASPDVIDSSQMMAPLSQETESERFEAIRNYSRKVSSRHTLVPRAPSRRGSHDDGAAPPVTERRRDTHRVSLVAGRVVPSLPFPALTPLTPSTPAPQTTGTTTASSPPPVTPTTSVTPPPKANAAANLQSFSPFRSPTAAQPNKSLLPRFDSVRSAASYASSTGVPSECPTPTSETAGGAGGRGIDDYVILKEAGKGAYGLVMRAKVKGANGQPVGVSETASQAAATDTSRTR